MRLALRRIHSAHHLHFEAWWLICLIFSLPSTKQAPPQKKAIGLLDSSPIDPTCTGLRPRPLFMQAAYSFFPRLTVASPPHAFPCEQFDSPLAIDAASPQCCTSRPTYTPKQCSAHHTVFGGPPVFLPSHAEREPRFTGHCTCQCCSLFDCPRRALAIAVPTLAG
jgi:hypothetical protein